MRKKIGFMSFITVLFLLTAGTAFASAWNVADDYTTGYFSTTNETGTTSIVLPYTTSCGLGGKTHYAYGFGTTSSSYYTTQWKNVVDNTSSNNVQFRVYIPNCVGNSTVTYWAAYTGGSSAISVNQSLYSDIFVDLGTYYVQVGSSSFIRMDNYKVSTTLTTAYDDGNFSTQ